MSNANNITAGHLDRLTGTQSKNAFTPTLNDATSLIRKMKLTPEDCMTLLNVISTNLCDQRKGMHALGFRDSFQGCVTLSETSRLLDDCADEISNVEGVTV
jgi:hypothetical protein